MAIQTTANLTNSIAAVYKSKYILGANQVRLYDQFATPYTDFGADGKTMDELMHSSSINVPFMSDMEPGVTAISETADTTPQTLIDATANMTWTSRGESLQWSEKLVESVYTDYTAQAYNKVGQNAMESIELLAEAAALQGSWVERATTRTLLDAGTATHRASDSIFRKYDGMMQSMRVPGYLGDDAQTQLWSAVMHPFCFHDIGESGNVDVIGQYTNPEIHLNWQLGQIGRFRLLSSPYAKVFGAAGAVCTAGDVDDSIAVAVNALATTLTSTTNVAASAAYGMFWWLGTEETANVFYPTNEPIKVLSAVTTAITFMGRAPNGGLRFSHPILTGFQNNDSVYTICFGGPQSLVKVFATDVGEFGKTVGPKVTGNLDQFNTLSWKYYGNYKLLSTNRILRFECSTSYEA